MVFFLLSGSIRGGWDRKKTGSRRRIVFKEDILVLVRWYSNISFSSSSQLLPKQNQPQQSITWAIIKVWLPVSSSVGPGKSCSWRPFRSSSSRQKWIDYPWPSWPETNGGDGLTSWYRNNSLQLATCGLGCSSLSAFAQESGNQPFIITWWSKSVCLRFLFIFCRHWSPYDNDWLGWFSPGYSGFHPDLFSKLFSNLQFSQLFFEKKENKLSI